MGFRLPFLMMLSTSNDPMHPVVQAIVQRRLTAPMIVLLELMKPLRGCLRELFNCAGERVLIMVVGERLLPVVREVLSSPEKIEELILRLEAGRDGDIATLHPERG